MISYLLHPMLIPVYVLIFLFSHSVFVLLPATTKWNCLLVTFVFLVVIPIVSLPLLRHFHLIRSYSLDDKQERIYPVLVTVGAAFAGFWFLGMVAQSGIVQQLYLILIILLSVFSVITLRWKISMHMTAMGGLCGFILSMGLKYPGDIQGCLVLFLLLSGLLASARLLLKKHTPLQVYSGFLFGFCFVLGMLVH